jgi:acetate CoA/acetoacetate CoA-transferase beta subunit
MGLGSDVKGKMAKRAAKEVKEGMIVNLGIGIPSLVPNYIPSNFSVTFHAENGIIGVGAAPKAGFEDENLCNAGGYPVTLDVGGSYCDSSTAFAMIRRGKIDLTVLGALQVSEQGDLANWIIPGKKVPGIGGATELAAKAKKVLIVMTHVDKKGNSKLVKDCTFPLTAEKCVSKIITDRAVFSFHNNHLILEEIFHPWTLQNIKEATEAQFSINSSLSFIS